MSTCEGRPAHKVLNQTPSGLACFPVDGSSDHIVGRGSISPPASQKPKNAFYRVDIAGDHTGHLDSADETSRPSLAMLGNAKTLACLAMLLAPRTTVGSIGDLSPSYQRCVNACSHDCPRPTPLLWSCRDDCQYRCMQHLTDLSLRSLKSVETREYVVDTEGLPLGEQVQYHGKWAFHRLGGPVKIQEPLSVVFSFGNLVAHHRGLMKLSRHTKFHHDGSQSPRLVYRVYALFGINAWIWSCVFHTRDLSWTEKADYFGAAALMVCGLWAAVMRISGLSFTLAATTRRVALAWTVACALLVIAHCWYLTRKERFDYGYNMRFNIATAIATILLWSAWSFYHCILIDSPSAGEHTMFLAPGHQPAARSQTMRAPHACMPVLPLLLLPLLTSLELLDFAPIGVFGLRLVDAHALWHASTIPVVSLWYRFLAEDVWTCCCSVCPCQPPHIYSGGNAIGVANFVDEELRLSALLLLDAPLAPVIVRISKRPLLTQTPPSRHHGTLFGRYLVTKDTKVPSPVPSPDANHLHSTLRFPLRMRTMCEPTPERPCQLGN
ncbi:BQ5605_C003g01962 [Microbotryum silenes-dioicae]|uniref:BQ5605_C003g01962 protein n=1 Tax=Microbotryum silenes-dioicae TaxID=796604 RepID=A0A2X0M4J5_9BASI|nr:BQ5605_C003g01962 [Microbotryum silenes-dioicae]